MKSWSLAFGVLGFRAEGPNSGFRVSGLSLTLKLRSSDGLRALINFTVGDRNHITPAGS